MREPHAQVKLAVELLAAEVAKVASEFHSVDMVKAKRNLYAMTMAVVVGAMNDKDWTDPAATSFWTSAEAGRGGVDKEKLSVAVEKWWASLDEKAKLAAIMGPAGHHDSEYMNNIVQKYQDQPEAKMAKEAPELHKVYKGELGGASPAAPAPAPAPVEQAPSMETGPKPAPNTAPSAAE